MSLQDRLDNTQSDATSLQNRLPHTVLPGLERRYSLARAMMMAAREPMAILDQKFRVLDASRAYVRLFPASFNTGRPFCEPSPQSWSDLALRTLQDVVASGISADAVEIDVDSAAGGRRRMLLNAHPASDRQTPQAALIVGLKEVTDPEIERLKDELTKQQSLLLQEAHHRIANSLQIIASILLLKARSVTSEETRVHLRDVHKRLILVAEVQRQLCSSGMLDAIEFGPYVAQLCHGLADSMTDGDNTVTILTSSTGGKIKADDAISFGLIVTELVINALKHGYPDGRQGCIAVDFATSGADWRLSVSDDGIGRPPGDAKQQRAGLGTNIVEALARHLKATVEIGSNGTGATTTIVHVEAAGH